MDEFMQMAIEEAQATKTECGQPFGTVQVREGRYSSNSCTIRSPIWERT